MHVVDDAETSRCWKLDCDFQVKHARDELRPVFEKYGAVKNVYIPCGPWCVPRVRQPYA